MKKHLRHAKIMLRVVVRIRCASVKQKSQHAILALLQSAHELMPRTSLVFAVLFLAFRHQFERRFVMF